MKSLRENWGTRKSPGKLRLIVVVVITAILGVLIGTHAAQESKSLPPIVQPKIKLVFCIEESGMPCTYKPGGVHDALMAGALGPRHVTVPAAVRKAFRAAVHRRGPAFETRVKNQMTWYQNAIWLVNCLPSVGIRQVTGNRYPRCASQAQMKARWGRIRSVTTSCTGNALIGTGVGSVFGDRRAAVLGAVTGGVTCAVSGMVSIGRKAFVQDGWSRGLDSAVPGSHWLPATLKLRW